MIVLKTGVPGSGKTLSAVHELFQAVKREPERSVFVHGVKALSIPHRRLPVTIREGGQKIERREYVNPATGEVEAVPVVVQEEDHSTLYEVDWSHVPDGSLVIVDEAQRVFPMRGAGNKVPPYIAWLNTHRHRGIDIWVITQHPKLIDNAVRRLVGKHQHYRRMFGGQRAVCYEWDSCSDGLQFTSATKSYWPYPKKAFSYYHSAEVHTKQRFRLPAFLIVPALAIPLGIFAGPKAYSALHGAATGKGVTASSSVASGSVQGATAPPAAATTASAAAAAYYRPAMSIGVPVRGCWAQGERCECIGDQGRRVNVDVQTCRISAASFDGLVQWEPSRAVRYEPKQPASVAAAPASAPAL